jgi:hypothetical protein
MVGELNSYDILVNDWVVFTDGTLPGESSDLGLTGSKGAAPVTEADGPVRVEESEESEESETTEEEGSGS